MPKEPLQFTSGDQQVTVSANWKLRDFLRELGTRDKSITATGGTDDQTLAGLLTTNTAPASSRYALFETLEWVDYLTYDANKNVVERRVVRGQPGFSSVVCSLGAIGLITRMQFSLIDQPFFEYGPEHRPPGRCPGRRQVEATSNAFDFWRIDWLPGMKPMDMGLLWTAKKVTRAQSEDEGDYPTDIAVNVLQAIFKIINDTRSSTRSSTARVAPCSDPSRGSLRGDG